MLAIDIRFSDKDKEAIKHLAYKIHCEKERQGLWSDSFENWCMAEQTYIQSLYQKAKVQDGRTI